MPIAAIGFIINIGSYFISVSYTELLFKSPRIVCMGGIDLIFIVHGRKEENFIR